METPLILAIETSGKTGGVCLYQGKALFNVTIPSKDSFCKNLFKIFRFLEEVGGSFLEKVDYYAIDVGPGSFTGLRIGLSVLKAFAIAYPKPVIPVTSLEVLASSVCTESYEIGVVINAYSKEVFFASYALTDGVLKNRLEPRCVKLEKLKELVKSPILFVSETPEICKDYLKKELPPELFKGFIQAGLSADKVAMLAYQKLVFQKDQACRSWEDVSPLYLKASEAERKTGLKVS